MSYNSTILVKKKKCISCGKTDYIFSKGRCKQCATIQSTQKRMQEQEDELDAESLQNLIEDADAIFSKYIRLKYADKKGIVQCYTCPTKLPISQIHNGHYVHRQDLATRWLEQNCRPQCSICNSKHNDDREPFKQLLEKERSGITDWLEEQAREVCKPTREDLRGMIADYRHKIKLLELKFKNDK